MAKGLEDTAFYRFNRLISLDEVGGNPQVAPGVRDAMHRRNLGVAVEWPGTMSASSTHDTKRSEDVRARIDVLSEMPHDWIERVRRWHELNSRLRRSLGGRAVPDENDELFLYQTLLGAWPLRPAELPEFANRLADFAIKAAREEKEHTSWLQPEAAYEEALLGFIRDLVAVAGDPLDAFSQDFLPFQATVAWLGALNSISQTLVKALAPGVPDFYQGTELWDFSLVDPDNRRAVDFGHRRQELGALLVLTDRTGRPEACARLLRSWKDGLLKLFVIHEALARRRADQGLFREGGYLPLEVRGLRHRSVFAFARLLSGSWLVVVVPRLLAHAIKAEEPPLGQAAWGDTALILPPGAPPRWRNSFTDELLQAMPSQETPPGTADLTLPLESVFETFPWGLLEPFAG
jgi:(1->4)-alpha-D-glucan 1-alpha-D-glucosylmutase